MVAASVPEITDVLESPSRYVPVMAISNAVQVNPHVRLERGREYAWVGMSDVTPDTRGVRASVRRPFTGSGSRFEAGDTLMARITPCLENGKIARYCPGDSAEETAHGSTEFIVLRGRPGVTDTTFVHYLAKSDRVRNYAIAKMTGSSGRQRVPLGALDHLMVPVPSLADQCFAAHTLGTLDDLIDLNTSIDRTLDTIARSIFDDWFVDFGPTRAKVEGRRRYLPPDSSSLFPGSLVESTVGPIPAGWSAARFGESFELTMGQSPPGSTYNTATQGLPFLQGRADFGSRYAAPRRFCSAPARVATPEDTLVSVRAPIGAVNIARDHCCIGRGVAAVRHRSGSAAYTYQSLCRLRPVLESFESTGTVFGAVTKTQFESLLVVEPPAEVVEAFDRLVGPLHERIRRSVEASEKLGELRDRLGERLVSGQLRPDGRGRGSAPGRGDAGGQRVVGEAGEGRVTGATGC